MPFANIDEVRDANSRLGLTFFDQHTVEPTIIDLGDQSSLIAASDELGTIKLYRVHPVGAITPLGGDIVFETFGSAIVAARTVQL